MECKHFALTSNIVSVSLKSQSNLQNTTELVNNAVFFLSWRCAIGFEPISYCTIL